MSCEQDFFLFAQPMKMKQNELSGFVGTYNSDAGEPPERKNTTLTTKRKFEINV